MHTHRAVKTGLYHLKIAIPTSGGGAPLKLGVPLQTEIIGGPNTKGAWIDAPRVWKALGAMIPSPEISFIFLLRNWGTLWGEFVWVNLSLKIRMPLVFFNPWFKKRSSFFTARCYKHSADYAVAWCRPISVYISVTRRYSIEAAKHIIKLFLPSGSPTILVFAYQMTFNNP